MAQIVPTVLASTNEDFIKQMANVSFANHIHIDFMDGSLTDTSSISLEEAKWSEDVVVDLHVMYDKPQEHLQQLIQMKPNMVIVQAESYCDIVKFAADLREAGIKTGLAIQPDTTPQSVKYVLPHVQQVLIFSGHLGHFGGQADLSQLEKIAEFKNLHRWLEFAWDGGANETNVKQIAEAGVEVINVGGAIQKSDNPTKAYYQLTDLIN